MCNIAKGRKLQSGCRGEAESPPQSSRGKHLDGALQQSLRGSQNEKDMGLRMIGEQGRQIPS